MSEENNPTIRGITQEQRDEARAVYAETHSLRAVHARTGIAVVTARKYRDLDGWDQKRSEESGLAVQPCSLKSLATREASKRARLADALDDALSLLRIATKKIRERMDSGKLTPRDLIQLIAKLIQAADLLDRAERRAAGIPESLTLNRSIVDIVLDDSRLNSNISSSSDNNECAEPEIPAVAIPKTEFLGTRQIGEGLWGGIK